MIITILPLPDGIIRQQNKAGKSIKEHNPSSQNYTLEETRLGFREQTAKFDNKSCRLLTE